MNKLAFFIFFLLSVTIIPLGASLIREWTKLITFSITATAIYGIINNQVTARICPEYFTKGFHGQEIKNTFMDGVTNPTILGLYWGSRYAPLIGGLFSIPLLLSGHLGTWPKITCQELIIPTISTFTLLGLTAIVSGIHGYKNADSEKTTKRFADIGYDISLEKKPQWAICEAAHEATYYYAKAVPAVLVGYIAYKRLSK